MVSVHGVGVNEQTPYYAMEYVPGADLDCVWRELSGTDGKSDRTGSNWSAAMESPCRMASKICVTFSA